MSFVKNTVFSFVVMTLGSVFTPSAFAQTVVFSSNTARLIVDEAVILKRVDRNPSIEFKTDQDSYGPTVTAVIAEVKDEELEFNQFIDRQLHDFSVELAKTESCKIVAGRMSQYPVVEVSAYCQGSVTKAYGQALIAKAIELYIKKYGETVVFPIKTYDVGEAEDVLKLLGPASNTTCGDASLVKVKQ